MSRHQNARQNQNKTADKFFENVEKLNFGTTIINQNRIHEEIKRR
jgi:hypothetical protein